MIEYPPEKPCTACGETKPIEEFPTRNGGRYRKSECKACTSKRYREWYERRHQYNIERSRRYYEENRAAISPVAVARAKRWAQNNPERYRKNSLAVQNRRRARKMGTAIGDVDYDAIIKRDQWVCHICGGHIEQGDNHFDHVIPLAKGGPHTESNIKMSHSRCNARKAARIESQGAHPNGTSRTERPST